MRRSTTDRGKRFSLTLWRTGRRLRRSVAGFGAGESRVRLARSAVIEDRCPMITKR
jgi:hypothetical protein